MKQQFTINSVDVSSTARFFLGIRGDRYLPYFTSRTDSTNINVGFIQLEKEKNPLSVITYRDLPENNLLRTETSIGTIGVIYSNSGMLLITDQFYSDIPLFYKHIFSYLGTTDTLSNIRFLDSEGSDLGISVYSLSTDCVYYSIETSPAFIQYSITTSTGSTETYTELLNSQQVCSEASWEDLDSSGNITNDQKFLLNRLVSSFSYTFSSVKKRAWKRGNKDYFYLTPTETVVDKPWNVLINRADFISHKTESSVANYYRYYIPEFSSQFWNPYPYYRYIDNEVLSVVSLRLLKASRGISTTLPVEILVYTGSSLIAAFTTDSTKIGSTCSGSIEYEEFISSVNNEGYIHLATDTSESNSYICNFYTEDNLYLDNRINFNPVQNLDISNSRVVFYINPETSFSGTLSSSVNYLLVDDLGRITYCSQTGTDQASIKLQEDFDSGIPRRDIYFDVDSSVSGLNSRVSGVNLDYLDEFSFLDKYTTASLLLTTVSGLSNGAYENYLDNPMFFVLGSVSLQEGSLEDVYQYDARTKGGGIRMDDLPEVLNIQREALWYADIPLITYPGMSSVYIEVPEENDINVVRSAFEKYSSAGSYAVIRKRGINPVIMDYIVTSSGISISWPSYGVGREYEINYSVDNTIWSQITHIDSGSENLLPITGLQSNTKYYIYVETEESSGPTIQVKTEV